MSTKTKLTEAEAKKAPPAAGTTKSKQRPERSASKTGKLVCRYCGSDDLAPSFFKASRRPLPRVLQAALLLHAADAEDSART